MNGLIWLYSVGVICSLIIVLFIYIPPYYKTCMAVDSCTGKSMPNWVCVLVFSLLITLSWATVLHHILVSISGGKLFNSPPQKSRRPRLNT